MSHAVFTFSFGLCMVLLLACNKDSQSGSLTARYLMAFHTCDSNSSNCGQPTNHITRVAQSDDSITWTAVTSIQSYAGSVPDMIRRGGTLYLYNPGTVRRFTISSSTLGDSAQVTVYKSDGTKVNFVDPSPILDSNNRIILFYLVSTTTSGDPATCATYPCTKNFGSATERDGSDGSSFDEDSGNRYSITIASGSASDPDIFQGPSDFVLYISKGNDVVAATATTLQGTYANVSGLADGVLSAGNGGVPAGHYHSATGKFWTFVHSNLNGQTVIRRAEHSSISSQLSSSSFSTIVSGDGFGLTSTTKCESPGFLTNSQ